MIVLGTLTAALTLLFFDQSVIVDRPIESWHLGLLLSFFCLPILTSAGSIVFFPNNVFWSLLGEIIINFFFALFAGISLRRLIALYAVLLGLFALIGFDRGYIRYNFQNVDMIVPTLLRVAVSFYAGVLVCRLRTRFGQLATLNPVWLVLILTSAVLLPGGVNPVRNLVNLLYIGFGFPLIVWLAADAKPLFPRIGAALGDLSFPLYALHLPIVAVIAPHIAMSPLSVKIPLMWVAVGLLCLIALFVDRAIDLPVRSFLLKRIKRRRSHSVRTA